MKRLFLFLQIVIVALTTSAGGLMTNTNYHIAFDRMMARGATSDIDAIYSNPAGIAWTHEGFQLSFNWQYPRQDRDITATFPLFPDENHTHKFHGDATAPFVPGLFASYRKGDWSLSAMIGIVGSGGYVKYDEGIPMFSAPVMAMLYSVNNTLTPTTYDLKSQMKGKQYIFGGQLNFAYRFNEHLSAAIGGRLSYYSGYYRGGVNVTLKQPQVELLSMALDTDQKGWGFAPLLGLNYRVGGLTLAAKYEFRTKLNIPNDTKTLTATVLNPTTMQPMPAATVMALVGDKLAPYQDGVKTRYDMPALLSVAAGYEFIPDKLRATVEYHFFDDKNAHMSGDREKALKRGTHEVLAGIEWDINKRFTVSAGGQRTDYGLSDEYQANTSFACDSYSVGLGGAVNITGHLRLNLGYFWTMYSDYTKHVDDYYGTKLAGTEVMHRTNRVLGIGVDYKF